MSTTTPTLVKCPDCHKSVSVAAASCPNCGRPFRLGELSDLIPADKAAAQAEAKKALVGVATLSIVTIVIMIASAVVIGILVILFC
jgi:endogenous inhibitor of DNA gyrase (YacG/DUF329 family)